MSELDTLELNIVTSGSNAEKGIKSLTETLYQLRDVTRGGMGLAALVKRIDSLNTAAKKIDVASVTNLTKLSNALSKLSNIGNLKLSSTIPNQIETIGNATKNISGVNFRPLQDLATSVKSLSGIGDIKISATIPNQLQQISTAARSLTGVDFGAISQLGLSLSALSSASHIKISSTIATQLSAVGTAVQGLTGINFTPITELASALQTLAAVGKIQLTTTLNQLQRMPTVIAMINLSDVNRFAANVQTLATALTPLTTFGRQTISTILNQLERIPTVFAALNQVNIAAFAAKIQQLTTALQPLATAMSKVSNGFAAFPSKLKKVETATNSVTASTNKASFAYVNFASKLAVVVTAGRRVVNALSNYISASNKYIESLNVFNAALGDSAAAANEYITQVQAAMGINPSDFMRNWGVFMTIVDGFGVASDRAYTMSKNLTSLAYDIQSFYGEAMGISLDESMQKLTAGISGELEPLRRLGYDLSAATLQATALSLGIDKSINSMTQAEKAELRYYAILTQVTVAQGDFSRTLDAPANQIRVLNSQVEQLSQAIGNIFIPLLNKVLPYVIAVTKVLRELANEFASLVGFELPEIDYSNISSGVSTTTDALADATDAVNKYKASLTGIDELNILGSPTTTTDDSGILGSGFDFDLPEYDFIGEASLGRINAIVDKIKDFLGFGEILQSWATLFNGALTECYGVIRNIGNVFMYVFTFIEQIRLSTVEWFKTLDFAPLMTALQTLHDAFMPFLTLVGDTLSWVYNAVLLPIAAWAIEDVAPASVNVLTEAFRMLVDILTPVINGIKYVWSALQPVVQFIEEVVIVVLDGLGEIFAEVGAVFDENGEEIENVMRTVGDVISRVWTIVRPILEMFKQNVGSTFGFIADLIGNTVKRNIGVLDGLITFLTGVFTGDWGMAWEGVKKIFSSVADGIKGVALAVWDYLKQRWEAIKTSASGIWENIKTIASDVWDGISDAILGVVRGIRSGITTAFNAVKTFVTKCFTSISKVSDDVWNNIWGSIKFVINGIIGGVEAMSNGVIKGLNFLIDGLNKISFDIPDWVPGLGGKKFGFTIKKINEVSIPRLADGGVVNSGQMFIAREAGPEIVGNIGNRTAVLNNDQIVNSVSKGVADANSEQNALLREQNDLLRRLYDKDPTVRAIVDTASVVSGLQRKNRRDGRTVVPVGV